MAPESDPKLPNGPDAHARALLERWGQTGDVDALDKLLRSEVDILARRLRARGGGAISVSLIRARRRLAERLVDWSDVAG